MAPSMERGAYDSCCVDVIMCSLHYVIFVHCIVSDLDVIFCGHVVLAHELLKEYSRMTCMNSSSILIVFIVLIDIKTACIAHMQRMYVYVIFTV